MMSRAGVRAVSAGYLGGFDGGPGRPRVSRHSASSTQAHAGNVRFFPRETKTATLVSPCQYHLAYCHDKAPAPNPTQLTTRDVGRTV